jgi:very-short-patch-repair endonuclease
MRPEPQFWLRFEGRAHPFDVRAAPGVVVEIDDWETHGLIEAQDKDREQDRWARRAGLTTVRTTPREVRDRIHVVVRDIETEVRRAAS